MLFLKDTAPFILTEDGDDIATEQNNDLYGDNVTDLVELVIPTKRTAETGNLTLITTHEVSKVEFSYRSVSVVVKTYKVEVVFNFNKEMPPGQYGYSLLDEKGELQKGLMQVGQRQAKASKYKPEIKVTSYEG